MRALFFVDWVKYRVSQKTSKFKTVKVRALFFVDWVNYPFICKVGKLVSLKR